MVALKNKNQNFTKEKRAYELWLKSHYFFNFISLSMPLSTPHHFSVLDSFITEFLSTFSCLIKLYAEAPLITDDAIDIIKGLCVSHYELGLNIFYQMVICRPPKQLHCLNALLSLCTYNSTEVR